MNEKKVSHAKVNPKFSQRAIVIFEVFRYNIKSCFTSNKGVLDK